LAIRLLNLLIPSLLILSASSLLLDLTRQLSHEHQQLLASLPYILGSLTVLLGYGFNRSRILLTGLNLTLCYWMIRTGLQTSINQPEVFVLFSALSLLLPVNQMLISTYHERGCLNPVGVTRVTIVAAGYLLLYLLLQNGSLAQLLPELPVMLLEMVRHGLFLSEAAAILFGLSMVLSLVMLAVRKDNTDAAVTGVLLTAIIVFAWFNVNHISILMFSAAQLMLIFAVVQNTYNMAFIDELTSIPSRRALRNKMSALGRRYSIAMMDIDHFKKFNDTYGHDIGDQVLRLVASRINQVGGGGKAYRYGGEEFTIVFNGKTEAEVLPYLEEIRQAIESYPMRIRQPGRPKDNKTGSQLRGSDTDNDIVHITISIGVCQKSEQHDTPDNVIKDADRALYRAKESGRNCTITANS